MTTILCTLYNSLYLDKGLVLYDSLCECAKDFKLYVLCMDDRCYEVLMDLKQEYVIPIRLADFENGDTKLLEAKKNRSFGEYCWTCTPSLIYYVINTYNESICTYIDADMYFYNDPQILIEYMFNAGKSVLIVPHRFSEHNKHLEKHGKYCVQFNSFCNTDASIAVLKEWRLNCLADSSIDNNNFGDQKYLDSWPVKYSCIYICTNPGAGIAPWNIESYYHVEADNNVVGIKDDNSTSPIFFYHFQNITYINRKIVSTNIDSGNADVDYRLIDSLYIDYLRKIDVKKKVLADNYFIDVIIKEHPVLNSMGLFWHLREWFISFLRRLLHKNSSVSPYIVSV